MSTSSSNVIGPFSADDWFMLREIRSSLRHMREVNYDRYRLQIEKETGIYWDIIGENVKRAA